jgi:hypothetical protein
VFCSMSITEQAPVVCRHCTIEHGAAGHAFHNEDVSRCYTSRPVSNLFTCSASLMFQWVHIASLSDHEASASLRLRFAGKSLQGLPNQARRSELQLDWRAHVVRCHVAGPIVVRELALGVVLWLIRPRGLGAGVRRVQRRALCNLLVIRRAQRGGGRRARRARGRGVSSD